MGLKESGFERAGTKEERKRRADVGNDIPKMLRSTAYATQHVLYT